ncbi:MAG: hypothetical protein KatS3mg108_0294 [Isosphaeraceae bacterium]|nr:MAG: hypothetical protein KatS3mg108_0294 [Isosphaeraceae bacterium]
MSLWVSPPSEANEVRVGGGIPQALDVVNPEARGLVLGEGGVGERRWRKSWSVVVWARMGPGRWREEGFEWMSRVRRSQWEWDMAR